MAVCRIHFFQRRKILTKLDVHFAYVKRFAVRHAIQHPSISRKHFVIEVSPVLAGDGVCSPRIHEAAGLSLTETVSHPYPIHTHSK
jgi:hypothetical protein